MYLIDRVRLLFSPTQSGGGRVYNHVQRLVRRSEVSVGKIGRSIETTAAPFRDT